MSGPNELPEVERLASDPELGDVLRRANLEYRAGLDESAAYRRVGERLAAEAPRPRQRMHAVTALGFACAAAAGWLVWLQVGRIDAPEVVLGPEVSVGERALGGSTEPSRAAPDPEAEPHPEPMREAPVPSAPSARKGLDSVPEPSRDETPRAAMSGDALEAAQPRADDARRRDEHAAPEARERKKRVAAPARQPLEGESVARRTPRHADPPPAAGAIGSGLGVGSASAHGEASADRELARSREDCLELARRGDPRAAERCFDQRAAGSGLGAEMALYEMARLRRDVLRDAIGALAALSAYRERFERGSLRNEVDLSRVELLAELGRSTDALRESSAMLASSSGRERAAELHLLRGDVYRRDLKDLRSAAAEYAQAEALGGSRGAEASRRLGACLEGLGDVAGALAAYRRYVAEPGRTHAAEVRRRIDRLTGAPARAGTSR